MPNLFRKPKKLSDAEIDAFVHDSLHELIKIQDQNRAHYGVGDGRWDYDLEKGMIVFTQPGKLVTASIQVIGTLNHEKNTFMWAWDHPSVPKVLSEHALLVKAWGEANELPIFSTRIVECDEAQAWEFTAIARRLAKADGAYVGRGDKASPFLTLSGFKITEQ
jgi:hypothetical protein